MKEYHHREVSISLHTCLASPEIKLLREIDLEDGDDILARLQSVAGQFRDEAFPLLRTLNIPAEPLAGDSPLIQVEIEYMEVGDEVVASFNVISTETLTAEERVAPFHRAISKAMVAFRTKLPRFVESEDV